MGRHAADTGAGVHPIVAAALERRQQPAEPGVPRHSPEAVSADVGEPGGLGWPAEPTTGGGLGWPAESEARTGAPAEQPAEVAGREQPRRPRRGWRRLFGGSAAA